MDYNDVLTFHFQPKNQSLLLANFSTDLFSHDFKSSISNLFIFVLAEKIVPLNFFIISRQRFRHFLQQILSKTIYFCLIKQQLK